MYSPRNARPAVLLVVLVLATLAVSGCAHQPAMPRFLLGQSPPGFFAGLFHGLTIPFAFVGSLFSDVRIYAWPNEGHWYDLGFTLGAGALAAAARGAPR